MKNKPAQYSMAIDTVMLSQSNDSLEEQLAICRFQINKYNNRRKGQDASDVEKLLYYANWKSDIIQQMDRLYEK